MYAAAFPSLLGLNVTRKCFHTNVSGRINRGCRAGDAAGPGRDGAGAGASATSAWPASATASKLRAGFGLGLGLGVPMTAALPAEARATALSSESELDSLEDCEAEEGERLALLELLVEFTPGTVQGPLRML